MPLLLFQVFKSAESQKKCSDSYQNLHGQGKEFVTLVAFQGHSSVEGK